MHIKSALLIVVSTALGAAQSAVAHHAFSPVFDGSRTVTVEGVVTEFRFINPHSIIEMDVTDEAGNTVQWSVEMAGRLNLVVGGWTQASISPGERVTISGNPAHSGSPNLFLQRLVRADGTELMTPGAARISTIEEQRRRRARQRSADRSGNN